MNGKWKGFLFAAMILLNATSANGGSNVLLVLDGSGSMWGTVDGVHKIDTAKDVTVELVKDLPADTSVGIMAYGHRSDDDCGDVELLAPMAAKNDATLEESIRSVTPKGKTPITKSLEQALPVFESLAGQNNNVVLISDGMETCGGDPCAVAGNLAEAGVNIRVHVVGFDVTDQQRKQMQCIADQGGGRYLDASTVGEFKVALAEVKEEVVNPAPEPETANNPEPPTGPAVGDFFDDFNGAELDPVWETLNPNPDSLVVDSGEVITISGLGSPWVGDMPNMMLLKNAPPQGDWVATLKFNALFQTVDTRVSLFFYQDKDNYLEASVNNYKPAGQGPNIEALMVKRFKGENSNIYDNLTNRIGNFKVDSPPFFLRIVKVGRKYTVQWMQEDMDPNEFVTLGEFTFLKLDGRFGFGTYMFEDRNAETTVDFDWIKIEAK